MKKSILLTTGALALSATLSFGAAITIADSSFETNAAIDGGGNPWSNDLSPEWSETAGPDNGAGFEEQIAGFAADGLRHVGMNNAHSIWQDLTVTFQPNTIYTLTVAAGNRSGQSSAGNLSTYSLYDATGASWATANYDAFANVAVGAFGDAPDLSFDTSANPGAVGQTIRIQLDALNAAGGGTGRSHFDNIRLDGTVVPEPTGFAFLGLAGLMALLRRRR